jgi:uncharacterized membrane protein
MRKALITLISVAVPRAALACPVCFGQNDSPLTAGMWFGIVAMLLVTVGVLAAFASFMIHLARRARVAADRERAEGAGFAVDGAGERGYTARAQGGLV